MAGPAVEPARDPTPESASTERPVLPDGLVFADVYTRFAAYFLDGVLLAALVSIPPAVLGLYDYASTYPPEPMPRPTFVGTTIFGLAIQAAYFLWFWTGGRRATPGQRVFGLQVGNAFDGQPLTMPQAITRWLAMGWWLNLLLLLPFFAVAVAAYAAGVVWWIVLAISVAISPTKQGLHDRIARSALVRPAGPTNRWAIGCAWLFIGLVVIELILGALFIYLVNSIQDAGFYPPGMNPLDYFGQQIREFWPS
ncbi:MAG TPA: RDD family protein [Candidatus Limnocylindrales bacterium]|nr:RDD family protein [Candidatus Limnocylindrales bacterium]